MKYKGYKGSEEYFEKQNIWYGRILNTRDLVTYEATSKQNLYKEFCEAVDEYISWKEHEYK